MSGAELRRFVGGPFPNLVPRSADGREVAVKRTPSEARMVAVKESPVSRMWSKDIRFLCNFRNVAFVTKWCMHFVTVACLSGHPVETFGAPQRCTFVA